MVRNNRFSGVFTRPTSRREFLKIGGVLIPVGMALPRLLEAQTPSTFDYYISPSGSDSNAGSLSAPWAITSLAPLANSPNYSKIAGKRIGLLPGTYPMSALLTAASVNDNNIALDIPGGTSSAPTYVGSSNSDGDYSPRTATIQGNDNGYYGGGNSNVCGMIGQSSTNGGFLTIDGLIITGGSVWSLVIGCTAGTNVSPSGIIVQNCEIAGNSAQNSTVASGKNCSPVQICSATDLIFQNNYIHDNYGWTDNEHFSAVYHWGLGTGTSGTQIIYNTIINSGGLQGKEGNQWNTTIAFNYIDMTEMTPGGTGAISAPIVGFLDDGGKGVGNGSVTAVHHNILISYAGGASDSPSMLGGTWIDLGYTNSQEYWDYPVQIYNNTCIASGALNGCGIMMFEQTAGSKLCTAYNNLFWDAGYDAVNQYGWWFTNKDIFSYCDYNLYGTHQGSQWATFSANGTQNEASSTVTTFAAWQSAIGGLDAHSATNATNPFTNNGALALQYQVSSGSPAYGAGYTGFLTTAVDSINIGAWDGLAAQIGCNFVSSLPVPEAPSLSIG